MNIEEDRFTRISARCVGLRMRSKLLKANDFGGQGGRLTPDANLFRATINGPNHLFNQQLNSSRWPIYCDHSVTSADVRLSVGPNLSRAACQRPVDFRQSPPVIRQIRTFCQSRSVKSSRSDKLAAFGGSIVLGSHLALTTRRFQSHATQVPAAVRLHLRNHLAGVECRRKRLYGGRDAGIPLINPSLNNLPV